MKNKQVPEFLKKKLQQKAQAKAALETEEEDSPEETEDTPEEEQETEEDLDSAEEEKEETQEDIAAKVRQEKNYLLNEGHYRHALLLALNNLNESLQDVVEKLNESNENLKNIGSVLEDFTG